MLQSITGNFGEVLFNYEGNRLDLYGGLKLKEIIVKNQGSTIIKKIALSQSYFKSDALPNPSSIPCQVNYQGSQSWRLKLDAVKDVTVSGSELPYTFEYDYNEVTNRILPSRLSDAQDHWGYYNGKNNLTLVPKYPSDGNYSGELTFGPTIRVLDGANRRPSEDHTKIGTLIKVNYPTGGYSSYEYEQNESFTSEYIHEVALPNEEIPYVDYARIESNTILAPSFPGLEIVSPPFTVSNNNLRNVFSFFEIGFIHPQYGMCDYDTRGDKPCRVFADILNENNDVVFSLSVGTTIKLLPDGTYKLRMRVLDKNEYTQDVVAYIRGPQPMSRVYNKKVGGLRIKSIKDYDRISSLPALSKEYKYLAEDNSTSSGKSNLFPLYHSIMTYSPTNQDIYTCAIPNFFQRTATSKLPLTSYSGSPVTYSRVEYTQVGKDQNLKSLYFYTADENEFGGSLYFPHPPGVNLEHRRGLLLREEQYKSNGNNYKIVSSTVNNYKPFCIDYDEDANTCPNMKWHYGLTILSSGFTILPGSSNPNSTMNLYKVLSEWIAPSETIVTTFDDSQRSIEKKSVYTFGNPTHGLVTKSTDIVTKKEVTVDTKYSSDYVLSAAPSGQSLAIQNIVGSKAILPVEKLEIEKNASNNEFVIGGSLIYYKPNNIQIDEIYTLDISSPIPVNDFTRSYINSAGIFVKDARYRKYASYNSYDAYGNIRETSKADDIMYTYLWGYKGAYPVAQVVGADYYTISSLVNQSVLDNASGQYSDLQIRNELNNLRIGLASSGSKALVTTYTYSPLVGMTSQTDPTGKTTYYEYDEFGRLDNIRDQYKNILKKFQYNYASTPTQSSSLSSSALNSVLSDFRRVRSGELNHFFATPNDNNQKFFTDTRDIYRDGVAKLPEGERTKPGVFYTSFNVNLTDNRIVPNPDPSKLSFMQNGYAVEWRVKMPANSYNYKSGNDYYYYVSINNHFTALFIDKYNEGASNGTYLYGYEDFDGNIGGSALTPGPGKTLVFDAIKISNDHLFNDFHTIKLQMVADAYNVYYDGAVIYTHSRVTGSSAPPVDNRFYLDAIFLGNDGAVDYIKVYDNSSTPVLQYDEEFNDPLQPAKLNDPSQVLPQISDCKAAFVAYFNSRMNSTYTSFDQIAQLYFQTTGEALNICN